MANIFKKIGKGLKKALSSKLGKLVMAGLAIYTAGAAMGAWGGASGATGAAAGTAGATGATGATAAGAAEGVAAAEGVSAANAATQTAAAAGETATAAGGGVSGTTALPEIVMQEKAKEGVINSAIKNVGGFVEKNPMASAMIFNAASSAASPDEMELLEEQERLRQQRWQNMSVPGSVGVAPAISPYATNGIINKGMRR